MDIRVVGFFVSFFILVGGLFFGSILLNFSSDIFFMVVSIVMLAFLGTFCYIYLGVNFPDRQITVMNGFFPIFLNKEAMKGYYLPMYSLAGILFIGIASVIFRTTKLL